MSDYQEAKKQAEKKSSASPNLARPDEETLVQKSFPCPGCGCAAPEGAIFCPECGHNLKAPSFCNNCGAAIIEGADICESCKSWILEDQCMFCYAQLEHDAVFCEECGNPRKGISCPNCGNLSIFDFCTKCGKPLTENAAKAFEAVKSDPDAKALVDSIQETVSIGAEIAKLEKLINQAPLSPSASPVMSPEKKMGRFSESKMAAILNTDKNIDSAAIRRTEEQKKAEDYARKLDEENQQKENERLHRVHEREVKEAQARMKALEEERAKALAAAAEARAKLRSKTFDSHQEARCFHNARKPANPRGWLCNFADCLHEDGPNGCYCPSMGGMWIE